jgi:hypothetical protein
MYRQALLTAVRVLVVPMAAVQAAVMALAVVRMAALVVVLAAAMAAAPVVVLAVTTVAALEQVPRLWSQVRSLGKWAQWSVVSAPRSAVLATH